jgi:hypothetical protein
MLWSCGILIGVGSWCCRSMNWISQLGIEEYWQVCAGRDVHMEEAMT